ncbi:MAG: chemotaxis protein CheW [Sulfurimonas sp.]|nr:chemotaxis protein CheW [Sulfurimonas sp.]
MQIEEILIIKNGSENYGISTEDINQISRVPMFMDLPLRPKGTVGFCAIGGNVITMIDINLLLGMDAVDLKKSDSRLLSLNNAFATNALLVSEVYNTVNIDKKNIEYANKNDDPVIAIYKYDDTLVQILSLDILFSKINKVNIQAKEIHSGKIKIEQNEEEDSNRFLIFAMGKEKFALNIEYLREIILADVNFTNIIGSEKELLGLITLREELIAIIDLRTYYNFENNSSEKNRILITSYGEDTIGLLVDEIIDIKNFSTKNIEYKKNAFEGNKIAGVIHDENSLISFFDKDLLKVIFNDNRTHLKSKNNSIVSDNDNDMEVIVFKLAEEEYAFDVEYVAEIIDVVDSIKVAFSKSNIDGIINIRGLIVTIVSLFDRLNIPAIINDDSKIIVCNINESKIGFIVDSISDILGVKNSEIKEQKDDLFTNILYLDNGDRLILNMDIQKIIQNKEE